MFRIFGKKKTVAVKGPQQSESDFLNDALNAYISTFPQKSSLDEFLAARNAVSRAGEIKSQLDRLADYATEYLYARAGEINWTSEFEDELYRYLTARHTWLSRSGFDSVASFGKWLCWHEGLNR